MATLEAREGFERQRMKLQDQRVQTQKKTFMKWVNSFIPVRRVVFFYPYIPFVILSCASACSLCFILVCFSRGVTMGRGDVT